MPCTPNRHRRSKILSALWGDQPELLTRSDEDRLRATPLKDPDYLPTPFGIDRQCSVESHRGALLRPRRLRGVELPFALFEAASPLVPGNGGADMVRASPLACGGDFLLRLTGCQGKDLIA